MEFRESVAGRVVGMVMVATIGSTAAILLITAEAKNLHNQDHDNTTQSVLLPHHPPPPVDAEANTNNEIANFAASGPSSGSVDVGRSSRQISMEAHLSSSDLQHTSNNKDASGEEHDNNLLDGVLAVLRRHLLEYHPENDHDTSNIELQNINQESGELPEGTHKIRHRTSKHRRRRRHFDPYHEQQQGQYIERVNPSDDEVSVYSDRNPFLRKPTELQQKSLDLQNYETFIALLNETSTEDNIGIQENQKDQISTINYPGVASSPQWLVVAMVGWSLVGMLLIILACCALFYHQRFHLKNLLEKENQRPLLMYDPTGSHKGNEEDACVHGKWNSNNSDKNYHTPSHINIEVKRSGFPPLHWLLSNLPPRDTEKTGEDYLDDACLLDDDCILNYHDSDRHIRHDPLLDCGGLLDHNGEDEGAILPRRSLSLTDLSV